MIWNWQNKNWPKFTYRQKDLGEAEARFLSRAGMLLGTLRHVSKKDGNALFVDLASTEALKTSESEGEMLNRDRGQSSIRRSFGMAADDRKGPAAEQGIARLMASLYQSYGDP